MPTKSYPFEEGGPDRVELNWGRRFRDFTVDVDGQRLNTEPLDFRDLRAGRELPLGDGTTLRVKFESGFKEGGLKVARDGTPLPGSAGHPATRMKGAATLVFIIAGLNAAFLAISFASGALDDPAIADSRNVVIAISLAVITLFIGLGAAIRRGSIGALWVAIALYAADTVLTLTGGSFQPSVVLIRGILLYGLWKALPAARDLREARSAAL